MIATDLVERAKDLAHRAHTGQVDKAGRPYIEHVARVAAACKDDPMAETVAWLHDVVEDCDHAFQKELIETFPTAVFRAVLDLTRYKRPGQAAYYRSISENPIALRVKLADIADNVDETRLALLDPETATRLRQKYAAGLAALQGERDTALSQPTFKT